MLKRLFDFAIALFLLLALLPLFVVTALLVRTMLGGPVLFRQQRPGMLGQPFHMIKFRTMTEQKGMDGELLPDQFRLTALGRFLRSTSIDELPELWHVLKGEMSLVGPRPLLMEYIPLYSSEQARRMLVKPGVTGWAQINGRNAVDWQQRFKMDVWYVDHQSFLLDLKILWITIQHVFRRTGINNEGQATMHKFTGN